jgi:hypothetical protein
VGSRPPVIGACPGNSLPAFDAAIPRVDTSSSACRLQPTCGKPMAAWLSHHQPRRLPITDARADIAEMPVFTGSTETHARGLPRGRSDSIHRDP